MLPPTLAVVTMRPAAIVKFFVGERLLSAVRIRTSWSTRYVSLVVIGVAIS